MQYVDIGPIRAGDFEPALDVRKAEETLVRLQEGRTGRRTTETANFFSYRIRKKEGGL